MKLYKEKESGNVFTREQIRSELRSLIQADVPPFLAGWSEYTLDKFIAEYYDEVEQ
jgi:hypothetical protein